MIGNLTKVLLILALGFLVPACRPNLENERRSVPSLPFTKTRWQDMEGLGLRDAERPGMGRDLVTRRLLIGKDYREVIDMLGEPDHLTPNNPIVLRYELVVFPGPDVAPDAVEYLKISFDNNIRVESAAIELRR